MRYLKSLILILFISFPYNVLAENKIVFIDIDFLMKNSNIGKISLKKCDLFESHIRFRSINIY